MPMITPFLWYDGQAEEAAEHYVSIFDNSRIVKVTRYWGASPGPPGTVMTVDFQLSGQPFVALNGGPQYQFTEAVSFAVDCDTQQQIDAYWRRLAEGGEPGPCGWLKDKYGVSWQVYPSVLAEMLADPDPHRSKRVMEAMLKMKKLDIEELQRAYEAP